MRASLGACSGCHAMMDPLGLAFEHYDGVGRYVTERDGRPVDATGTLTGTDVDGPFRNAVELGNRLAGSAAAAECFVERMLTFAAGAPEVDACERSAVLTRFQAGKGALAEVFRAIAAGPRFTTRGQGGTSP